MLYTQKELNFCGSSALILLFCPARWIRSNLKIVAGCQNALRSINFNPKIQQDIKI